MTGPAADLPGLPSVCWSWIPQRAQSPRLAAGGCERM